MLTTLLSTLGGATIRAVWGEVSAAYTKHQDHKFQLEMLSKQEEITAAQFTRNKELLLIQSELAVKEIKIKQEGILEGKAADTFQESISKQGQSTGFKFIDAWNASLRALIITEITVLLFLHYYRIGFTLDEKGWELAGTCIGWVFADRVLFRRGK